MADEKIWVSQLSYKKIVGIIRAYEDFGASGKIADIAKKGKIDKQVVSHASTFLISLGVIEIDRIKTHKKITYKGRNLARALQLDDPGKIKKCWAELIRDSPYYSLLPKLKINTVVSKNDLIDAIFKSSSAEFGSRQNRSGANSIIDILCQSGCIQKIDRKSKYLVVRNALPPNLDKFPLDLQPSLEKFFEDYPDFPRCAFIMMPFSDSKHYEEFHKKFNDQIFELIKEICLTYEIKALRADTKYYAEDILPNIKTYMHGCELGIAIFEKFENTVDPETEVYNPNVSFEVGYMMALKKPVLVLKDSRVSDLNSDLKSKIYNNFDKQQLQETIAPAIKKWVDKESLI